MGTFRTFRSGLRIVIAIGVVATPFLTAVPAARAAGCGDTISVDTTLTGDVGPCTNDPIFTVNAGVKLDLGGHTVFGDDTASNNGIVLLGGSTLSNGTVEDVGNNGVLVSGTGKNIVDKVTSRSNESGRGFLIDTSDNIVRASKATANGTNAFESGFDIEGSSNLLTSNFADSNGFNGFVVTSGGSNVFRNNRSTRHGNEAGFDDQGGGLNTFVGNVVSGGHDGFHQVDTAANDYFASNKVLGTEADGFDINGDANYFINNVVKGAGFPGDQGMDLDGNFNIVVGNKIIENFDGISVSGDNNRIVDNTAKFNKTFDLEDLNGLPCQSNTWEGNKFVKRNDPCIQASVSPAPVGVAPSCGDSISVNSFLTADVGPCNGAGPALTITGASLDMKGHKVFGNDTGLTADGIQLNSFATLRNGIVRDMGRDGVSFGTGANIVTGVTSTSNGRNGFLVPTNTNILRANKSTLNGGEGFGTDGNLNIVTSNSADNNGGVAFEIGGNGNAYRKNIVTGPGGTGLAFNLGATAAGDVLVGNTASNVFGGFVTDVATSGTILARNKTSKSAGDGYHIFSDSEVIVNNVASRASDTGFEIEGDKSFVTGNKIVRSNDGIKVAGSENKLVENKTSLNSGTDLTDLFSNCTSNIWRANVFTSKNPACIS